MAGSAVAGGLTMLFGISLRAPHGGVFVVPLVDGGWPMYLLAIVIGAIVTAILLGILKKPVQE
jgi:PTS system fructose-specific IIC component